MIDRNRDNPEVQIKAVHELRSIISDIAQLLMNLPAASTMSIPIPYDGNIMQQKLEHVDYEHAYPPGLGPNPDGSYDESDQP